jgi:hypothetical protein
VTENRSPHEPATSHTAHIAYRPALRKLTTLAAQYGEQNGQARDDEPGADDHARGNSDSSKSSRRSRSG